MKPSHPLSKSLIFHEQSLIRFVKITIGSFDLSDVGDGWRVPSALEVVNPTPEYPDAHLDPTNSPYSHVVHSQATRP